MRKCKCIKNYYYSDILFYEAGDKLYTLYNSSSHVINVDYIDNEYCVSITNKNYRDYDYFYDYFIDTKLERKLKLKKINETR